MINIEKIDSNGFPLYQVNYVDNYNDFVDWLYRLEDKELSLSYNGHLYRFRSIEERCQFVFGFQCAWNVIDDAYLQNCHGGIFLTKG